MPDGDDEDNFLTGPFGVMPIPPELARQMESRRAHMEMEQSAQVHSHLNLVDTMDEETLTYLKGVMSHVASHGEQGSDQASSWHVGFYAGVLWKRFSICPACEVNHDDLSALQDHCPTCGSPERAIVGYVNEDTPCDDLWHSDLSAADEGLAEPGQ